MPSQIKNLILTYYILYQRFCASLWFLSISVVPTSQDSTSPTAFMPQSLAQALMTLLVMPPSPCMPIVSCFRWPGRIHLVSTSTQQQVAESQLCARDEQGSWFRVIWWGTVHGGARHTVLFTTVSPVPRMCWIERRVHTLLLGDCCVYCASLLFISLAIGCLSPSLVFQGSPVFPHAPLSIKPYASQVISTKNLIISWWPLPSWPTHRNSN